MTYFIVLMLWSDLYSFSFNACALHFSTWNEKQNWSCISANELWAAIQGKELFFFILFLLKWHCDCLCLSAVHQINSVQPFKLNWDLKLILSFALHAPFSRSKGFTNQNQAVINTALHVQIILSLVSLCCVMHYNWFGLCKRLLVCW